MTDRPDDAERARTLVASVGSGALSTLGAGGFPFGSVVAHAVDAIGRPLLLLSDLAEHSRNLAADARASLLVGGAGSGDPLDRARVTLVGSVAPAPDALEDYRAVHGGTLGTDHGFRMYRLEVGGIRFVGGFARMSWVDVACYAAAEPDPLIASAAGIALHVNDDHADALVELCRTLGGRPDAATARMVDVDRYGFDAVAADRDGAQTPVRLMFDGRSDTPDAVRAAVIALLGKARAT